MYCLGNVIGNKGGVLVSFNVHHTSLAVLNCHLEAHFHNVDERNLDTRQLIRYGMLTTSARADFACWRYHDAICVSQWARLGRAQRRIHRSHAML